MSNELHGYEVMGALLARCPFRSRMTSLLRGTITDEELDAIKRALQDSVYELIQARAYYGGRYDFDHEPVVASAAGFADELMSIIYRIRPKPQDPPQRIQFDGREWELEYDPGRKGSDLRTDEQGRIWRKVKTEEEIRQEIPF